MDDRPFCILTDRLPTSVMIDGDERPWDINSKATVAIDCILKMSEDIDDAYKIQYTCKRIIIGRNEGYPDFARAFPVVAAFLSGLPMDDDEHPQSTRRPEPAMDYLQDADAIVAAFQQAYGLNLDETCGLHWWHFLALLRNLPDDTRMSEIIRIRTMPIDAKDSPKRQQAVRNAKKAVAIKDRRTPEQKKEALKDAFADL